MPFRDVLSRIEGGKGPVFDVDLGRDEGILGVTVASR
jgi:hypothetical protein